MKNILPRKYEVLTGSGTESLYIILKALDVPSGSIVAHTDSMCYSDSHALKSLEMQSLFLDIEAYTLNPLLESYKTANNKADYVLAVHGYGYTQDFSSISSNNLIEDAALVFPQSNNNVGSFGIASFLSFGSGKPFQLNGGSVVGTDDPVLFKEMKKVFSEINRRPSKTHMDLSKLHTSLYNSNTLTSFDRILHEEKNEFFYRSNLISKNHDFNYQKTRDSYLSKQEILKKIVSESGRFKLVKEYTHKDFPWRFSFLCPNKKMRTKLLYEGINNGLPISSWHPALSSYLGGLTGEYNKNAMEVGDRIINVCFSINPHKLSKLLWKSMC